MDARVVVEGGAILREEGDRSDVPWWSVTKTAIAAAALTLVGEGRLDLDARLEGRTYTLRQLLQHRAGLRDYGAVPAYQEAVARHEAAWPPAVMLEHAQADQPLYEPGKGWAYSNIGYFFVREILEQTTGEPLGQVLERRVLQPLAISGVRLATGRGELAPDYASGWVYHGSLIGPVAQAALFMDCLLSGGLLRNDLLATMIDSLQLPGVPPGPVWKSVGYGLGIVVGEVTAGFEVIGHNGGGPGSLIAVYRSCGRTAATFARGADQTTVEQNCVAMLM
jgi:CubicO group peptidase (beta-lactamase class C family)